MKVYQISYDLRKQRNYDGLYQRLKAYGTYCRALESTWLIATSDTATMIRDNLSQVMDGDDGLIVTRLQGGAAWRGLDNEISGWLKQQLSRCSA